MREELLDVLEEEGYVVRAAANGRDALRILQTTSVGLVLLDLMMPVMNGWELAEQIRTIPSLAHVPVLVMTASTHAPHAPVGPVFVKPLNVESLLRAVRIQLDGR